MHAPEDLKGEVLHDTYRVEGFLGQGGMGEVYEAMHLRLDRPVAIKIIRASHATRSDTISRFQREAKITSGLGHPHIVDVIDFHHLPDGRPYIVMELLQGEDLASRMERQGPLTLADAVMIFKQASSGIQAAHDKGIIHRDLKPQNIFLCHHGKRAIYVKVLDFGISKVLSSTSQLTDSSSVLGTPYYMAPEQAEQRVAEVSIQSDIYALGTIFFEMLAGRPPFTGHSIPAVLYAIVHQDPPDLRDLRSDVPEAVAKVIGRSLHKLPDQRYGSMAHFWLALAQALQKAGLNLAESTDDIHAPQPTGRIEADDTGGRGSYYLGQTLPMERDTRAPSGEESPTVTRPLFEPKLPVAQEVGKVTTLSSTSGEMRSALSRSKWRIRLAATTAAVVLVGAVSTMVLLQNGEEQHQPSSPELQSASPVPLQPDGSLARDVGVDAPTSRRLWLATVPTGAAVLLGDRLVGRTPLEGVSVPLDRLTLRIMKKGFKPSSIEVKPGSAPLRMERMTLKLLRRTTKKRVKPKLLRRTMKKRVRPSTKIQRDPPEKPGVKVRKGWIVDPVIE